MPLYGSARDPQSVVSLTEAGGAIGGTNDGDLPSLAGVADANVSAAIREVAAKLNELIAALKRPTA